MILTYNGSKQRSSEGHSNALSFFCCITYINYFIPLLQPMKVQTQNHKINRKRVPELRKQRVAVLIGFVVNG